MYIHIYIHVHSSGILIIKEYVRWRMLNLQRLQRCFMNMILRVLSLSWSTHTNILICICNMCAYIHTIVHNCWQCSRLQLALNLHKCMRLKMPKWLQSKTAFTKRNEQNARDANLQQPWGVSRPCPVKSRLQLHVHVACCE